ncbi:Ig-like domain-containing protein [Paractinoplanes lichenicola]|uniref:Uncharacterized protein n=1 Tax=Paractinoplanes lichenicola TaxID=2802976 RepID=A0ABS1W2N5_9ACTN|nr:Ig-like domain-containing protein [Actinoplanes lichenicola]MBL7261005.1 hypothetical protein [Actinoplanes lichenicola]
MAAVLVSVLAMGSTPVRAAEVVTYTLSPASGAIVHGVTELTFTDVSANVAEIAMYDKVLGTQLSRATGAPWTFSWDTVAQQGVAFRVVDADGRGIWVTRTYRVDNSGPGVSVDYGDSKIGVVPKGRNFVTLRTSDISPVSRVEFWIGGVQQASGQSFFYDFGPKSTVVSGEFRAWDALGNASRTPVTFWVDGDGPKLVSMTPASLALVRGTRIRSTVVAADRSGVQWVTLDNGTGSIHKTPYTDSVAAGKDGPKVLTWRLVDDYTQTSTVRRTVIVDNTRPSLKVTKAPANKAKVKGTVKVSVAANDRYGVARVELIVNGKVVARDTTAAYAFSVNTAKHGKTIKVAVRAYDRAGNATTTATRTWRR